jgi:NADPH2:quinone reductase
LDSASSDPASAGRTPLSSSADNGLKIVIVGGFGVGKTTFDGSLDALRRRGTLALFGAASGPVDPIDPQRLNSAGSVVLTRPKLADFVASRDELQWRAGELFDAVAAGALTVRIGGDYPLSQARRAHEDLQARRTAGKLLLLP